MAEFDGEIGLRRKPRTRESPWNPPSQPEGGMLRMATFVRDATGRMVPASTHSIPTPLPPGRMPASSRAGVAGTDAPNLQPPALQWREPSDGGAPPAWWTHPRPPAREPPPPRPEPDPSPPASPPPRPPLAPVAPLTLPPSARAQTAAEDVEQLGGRGANDQIQLGPKATALPAEIVEAAALAAASMPYGYYLTGAARARLEIFQRRGKLTKELTAIGMPPVFEPVKGVFVGHQVATEPEGPAGAKAQPAWRQLRQRANNPAGNPVMARNIRVKAQLAQAAARSAAAAAGNANPSGRELRHAAAMDQASRTIAKLRVVTGHEERRMASAPMSKPYYPHRRTGDPPFNEAEGGDTFPGKLTRLVAQQVADDEAAAAARAARARQVPLAELERRERIQALADVIVAAPQLGIRTLGVYTPDEISRRTAALIAAAEEAHRGSGSGSASQAGAPSPELAAALLELEAAAAAGRAVVAEADSDYGGLVGDRRYRGGGDEDGGGDGGSSYGSGGHYLEEEGMADEALYGEPSFAAPPGSHSARGSRQSGSGGDGASSGGPGAGASHGYPDHVVVEANPRAGLQAVRYPVGSAARRKHAEGRSPDRGVQAARAKAEQVRADFAAAGMPYDLGAMRRHDAVLANEVVGGRRRHAPPPPLTAGAAAGGPPSPAPDGEEGASAASPVQIPAPSLPYSATSAAMVRLPNEVRHTGAVRRAEQLPGAGMDTSGRWAQGKGGRPRTAGAGGSARGSRASGGGVPPWQRMSHAEVLEAALAAAEEAEAAARQAEEEEEEEAWEEEGSGEGERQGPGVEHSTPVREVEGRSSQDPPDESLPSLHGALSADHTSPTAAPGLTPPAPAPVASRPPSPGAPTTPTDSWGPNATSPSPSAASPGAPTAEDDVHSLGRVAMLSDDEEGGGGGRGPRKHWNDSSSSLSEDPWGREDVDELGYPIAFAEQLAAASQPEPEPAPQPESDDGTSSDGSWGVDYKSLGPKPQAASRAPLTIDALRQLAAAASAPGTAAAPGPGAAAAPGPGSGGDGSDLLRMFGLARERVVDPADIPALDFAPPPAWLVGPVEGYREEEAPRVQGSQGGSSWSESAASGPAGGAAEEAGAQPGPQRERRPQGRVAAALSRAKKQPAERTVQHDDRTFFFSPPPPGTAVSNKPGQSAALPPRAPKPRGHQR
ncbi:hypothetical protein HYH03_007017 [Edaphochlamys debaryana]|uniref:Uncharacterized protein n=1 Tax=Edaphochlamys debaryana TaxID=47281 RepID=A0A836C0R0_9CHLO|nr:hypothetical protein HYH03_007017 [Edaphochlamys debaryana]|eukprot:KAG2494773.1 hypothetical protein HYH03_007017 [Edaphochlamys debaryana]